VTNKYIPDEILKPFLSSYENGDVWQVHCGDRWLKVFVYTDDQIEPNKKLQVHQQMRKEYFKMVNEYLHLKLKNETDIQLSFDSKENFERKFNGDWYSFYH